jgi:hypothetical protein
VGDFVLEDFVHFCIAVWRYSGSGWENEGGDTYVWPSYSKMGSQPKRSC